MDGDLDVPFGPSPAPSPPPISIVPDSVEPLVVPDRGYRCAANNKKGDPCGFPHLKDSRFCKCHDPRTDFAALSKKRIGMKFSDNKVSIKKLRGHARVKTKEDLLKLLSYRIDKFVARFGEVPTPETEESICNMIRTYALVLRCELADEGVGGLPALTLKRRHA